MILKFIESIGKEFYIGKLLNKEKLKRIILFLKNLVFFQFYKSQIPHHAFQFSFLSFPVIFLTSLCTGAVLTIQTFTGLSFLAGPNTIARVVTPAIIRELGPVLTGLMIAGRIASSIAAELATMNTMDQINALRILSINPIKYLVLPRVFVGIFLMPLLLIIADVISLLGSYLVVTLKFKILSLIYIKAIVKFFTWEDLRIGIIKAFFFGGIITITGCFKGITSTKDSAGVGKSTTESVVLSSILILLFNYILTLLFF